MPERIRSLHCNQEKWHKLCDLNVTSSFTLALSTTNAASKMADVVAAIVALLSHRVPFCPQMIWIKRHQSLSSLLTQFFPSGVIGLFRWMFFAVYTLGSAGLNPSCINHVVRSVSLHSSNTAGSSGTLWCHWNSCMHQYRYDGQLIRVLLGLVRAPCRAMTHL